MEEPFDPYRKWLGIPPEEQPPNHYRLLGIALYEHDADVISNAADRQMAHVRTYQTGQRSPLSQKLLNELSAAKICLLNPDSKQQYDAQLLAWQSQLTRAVAAPLENPPRASAPAATPAVAIPTAIPLADPVDTVGDDLVPTIRTTKRKQKIEFPDAADPKPAATSPGSARPVAARPVALAPLVPNPKTSSPAAVAESPIGVTMRGTSTRTTRRSNSSAAISVVAGIGLLVLLILIAVMFAGGDGDSSPSETNRERPAPKDRPKTTGTTPTAPSPPTVPVAKAPENESPPLAPNDASPPNNDQTKPEVKPQDAPPDAPVRPVDTPINDPGQSQPPAETSAAPNDDEPSRAVPTKRPPPPATDAVGKSYRILRKELESQLRAAVAPEERFDLVQQIVERAAGESDPAAQYALYMIAHNLAVQLASADAACDVIDLLAARYDVDAFEMKRSAIDTISQFVTLGVEDYDHILRLLQSFAREAMAAEKSDAAVALSRLAKAASLKVRTPKALKDFPALEDLLADVDRLAADVGEFDREVKAFDRNRRQLEKEPNDAAANLGMGRYWLLVKGDWAKALPHFANSADPAMKDPAIIDLANPPNPAEQVALADAWAALAPRKAGLYAPRLLERAKHWYAQAVASAAESEKSAIAAKLAQVEGQLKSLRTTEKPKADAPPPPDAEKPATQPGTTKPDDEDGPAFPD